MNGWTVTSGRKIVYISLMEQDKVMLATEGQVVVVVVLPGAPPGVAGSEA